MRVLVQRSKESFVKVKEEITEKINYGMVCFVCFTETDTLNILEKMAKKLVSFRIFDDENGTMNKSLLDTKGSILLVSQFTLYADTKKGNRPSYQKALSFSKAQKMYEQFIEILNGYTKVECGIFGADMLVNIQNDGPVTLMVEYE